MKRSGSADLALMGGRIPVHPNNRPKTLKPKRVRKPLEKALRAVFKNDGFHDGKAQFGHSFK